jgi:outer membrane protein assembly factor BamB
MQLRKTLLVGLVSVTLLSGCSWFNSEEDVVTMSPLPKVDDQFTPTKVWSTSVGDGIGDYYSHLSPAWADGTVYAADRFGVVKSIDVDSGKENWKVSLADKGGLLSSDKSAMLSGGLTVADGHVYVGSENATVYAISIQDGAVAWKTSVAGEALSRPVVSDGVVLIHTGTGLLQALSESDGSIQWTTNLDKPSLSLRGESAPAVAFGAAIVGGDNGRVSAVLLKNGQMIWQQRISQPTGTTEVARLSDVSMTPVIANNVVYALAYNGNLVAMDLRSGQIIWKQDIGSSHNMIVDGSYIYLVDKTDRVMALSVRDGSVLWRQTELLYRNLTTPVIYNGYIVVGDAEGYLHWMNSDDGHFVVQQKVDSSGFLSAPIVASDKLVIQAKNGKVYSFTR